MERHSSETSTRRSDESDWSDAEEAPPRSPAEQVAVAPESTTVALDSFSSFLIRVQFLFNPLLDDLGSWNIPV